MINFAFYNLSELSVGQHWYLTISGYQIHAQTEITTYFVIAILRLLSIVANQDLKPEIPNQLQNITESVTEFIRDLAKTQVGESDYLRWIAFLGTVFLFIFLSNWTGALFPWKFFTIPNGELAAPTNDINTTVALALLTSIAYFYAGLSKKGVNYFQRYVSPAAFLLPVNVLEDFTKPLSLSFRLFGNILADELVVGVLVALVPIVVPIPLIRLGLFTSAIQALVFATLAGAYIGEAVEEHHLFYSFQLFYVYKIKTNLKMIDTDFKKKVARKNEQFFYNNSKRIIYKDESNLPTCQLKIRIASPIKLRWLCTRKTSEGFTIGNINNAKTVNYKTQEPFPGGLFCEAIFGPLNRGICACKKTH
jgi:F-type H+-transporting ATPase subunit a